MNIVTVFPSVRANWTPTKYLTGLKMSEWAVRKKFINIKLRGNLTQTTYTLYKPISGDNIYTHFHENLHITFNYVLIGKAQPKIVRYKSFLTIIIKINYLKLFL